MAAATVPGAVRVLRPKGHGSPCTVPRPMAPGITHEASSPHVLSKWWVRDWEVSPMLAGWLGAWFCSRTRWICLPCHPILYRCHLEGSNTGYFSRKLRAQPSLRLLGPKGVGCDVEEDGLLHGAARLRLKRWAGDELVLVARLLWAVLTSEVGPLGRETGTPPLPQAALLAVLWPSELDVCLVRCLGM